MSVRISDHPFRLHFLALGLNIMLLLAVYPGFMSYDSLHALHEARVGVEGGTYPPFVSYLWKPLDWLWPGPSLMLLFQNGLFLLATAHILYLLGLSNSAFGPLALIAITALPPILGTMIVVWKDVAAGAFFMAATAAGLQLQAEIAPRHRQALLATGLLMVLCGMLTRFNAASAALPLVGYLMFAFHTSGSPPPLRRLMCRILLQTLTTFILLTVIVGAVNNYRFPSFDRLKPNQGFSVIAAFDVIGMSAMRPGESPVPPAMAEAGLDVVTAKQIYDPRHYNNTIDNFKKFAPQQYQTFIKALHRSEIPGIWKQLLLDDPLAYFKHRIEVSRYLIGANLERQFLPTHYGIDQPNPLRITYQDIWLGKTLVAIVIVGVDIFMLRPWLIYLVTAFAVRKFHQNQGSNPALFFSLVTSATLYLLPMMLILPAADLRYNFWAVAGASLACWVSVCPHPLPDTYRK